MRALRRAETRISGFSLCTLSHILKMTDLSPQPNAPPDKDATAKFQSNRSEWVPILRLILLAVVASSLAIVVSIFVFAPENLKRTIAPVLLVLTVSVALWAYSSGRIELGRRLVTYGSFAVVAIALFFGGGIRSVATLALPPLVIASAVINPITGRNIAILSGVLLLALGVAESMSWLPPAATLPWNIYWTFNFLVLVVAAGIGRYLNALHDARTASEREITSQLQHEKATLADRERQLRMIAENIPALIFQGDRNLRCRYANRRYAEFFGFTPVTIVGKSVSDILGEEGACAIQHKIEAVLAGNSVRYRAVRRSAADGQEHHLDITFVPERDESGVVAGFYALKLDVTLEIHAEKALRESEAFLREAQRIGHIGSWEFDPASETFVWSDEITRIFETEMPSGTVDYPTFLKTLLADDRDAFDKAFRQSIMGGRPLELTYRLRMPDGRIKYLHVRSETQLGADGRPLKSMGTTQDITEQELARQEIRRLNAELEKRVQERTAELTTANRELESFAYSISHDLRAPLRGIDGFSKLLADEYRERLDEQGLDYLERVRRAAQRMGTLIDDILELSRVTRQEMRRVRVDLSQIAAEIVDERERAEPEHRVAVTLAPDCTAHGDPQLLRVLMQNLIENAWKYSARKPDPAIAFGREALDGETVFFVRDNGVGFDMKYADRLFTPFQRLHRPEEFEGTGIGLATVARIVRRHGGRVWIEAATGQGAIVRFTLP